jgi:hypothetical protein
MSDKIWNIPPHRTLTTTRAVNRLFIDENLPVGWLVKWGGQYDIPIMGKLVPTRLTCLCWTAQQWLDFVNNYIAKSK